MAQKNLWEVVDQVENKIEIKHDFESWIKSMKIKVNGEVRTLNLNYEEKNTNEYPEPEIDREKEKHNTIIQQKISDIK